MKDRCSDMGVGSCVWPGCLARFAVEEGPSVDGWKVFASAVAKVLLCPFHSDNGHGPQVRRPSERSRRVVFDCTCEGWTSSPLDSLLVGLRDWQEHVRMSLRSES